MGAALAAEARTCDVVLMAAAVADYRPARAAREKLKRSDAARTVELVPNEDLLAKLAAKRRSRQILVGFALETSDGVRRARAKLVAKGVDLIVLNAPEHSLGRETNRITLVERARARRMPERPKRELADAILARVLELRAAGASTTSSRSRTTRRGRAASPRSRNRRAPGAGAA
jgi:phosphopantothenoylcysteine decarboxylase/phosphopantothenate--cysteine ligase